jgi:hypothetical protein
MSDIKPEDQTCWAVLGQYGNMTLYFDKEHMFDRVTRTDKVYSLRLVDWKQL